MDITESTAVKRFLQGIDGLKKDGPLTLSGLHRQLNLSLETVTIIALKLADLELVSLSSDIIELTESGKKAVKESMRRPLTDFRPGDRLRVITIGRLAPDEKRYLSTLGIYPEGNLTLEDRGPFKGPVLVRTGASKYALGREIAKEIFALPADDGDGPER